MKAAEKYTQQVVEIWHEFDWENINFEEFRRKVSELFEQAQRDAYNEALMDAAMNVRIYKAANSGSWLDAAINTESILKLKKK